MIQAVPTHIITGFLGAGKTTLLNGLLAQKPTGETWAVLVNEYGNIGIDQALLQGQDGIAIKEVTGGCLCCTSQLPMQIALSRLLSSVKPDRLFIEPTGMGHAAQLVEQLSEPHWARALSLRAVVAVVNGLVLADSRYIQHEVFLAQVDAADMLFISHCDAMSVLDQQVLSDFKGKYAADKQHVECIELSEQAVALQVLDVAPTQRVQTRRTLLYPPTAFKANATAADAESESIAHTPPYHYVAQSSGHEVGGWRLPAAWVFDQQALLSVLYGQQDWLRIKGVVHTQTEWLSINLTPHQMTIAHHEGFADSRLEIIGNEGRDWAALEQQLMACVDSQTL